jgi:hypothetical protein
VNKIATTDTAGWRREAHRQRKRLETLTDAVMTYLKQSDVLMRQPSTVERGKQLAALSNALEMANDQARYFGLGINFRTDKKP